MAFAHVQGSFRDTFICSFPEIPGALESSQRAALVGDTSIRTAGIVEPSVSQKVDGGPEEGHGHGIYVIIVLIDSCLCDIISTDFDAKLMHFRCEKRVPPLWQYGLTNNINNHNKNISRFATERIYRVRTVVLTAVIYRAVATCCAVVKAGAELAAALQQLARAPSGR